MTESREQIERIVHAVMRRLGVMDDAPPPNGVGDIVIVGDAVVTEETLAGQIGNAASIEVSAKAVLTPSAQEFLRERNITVQRCLPGRNAATSAPSPNASRVYVINTTPALRQLFENTGIVPELLDCPDVAARSAAQAIADGEKQFAVIFAKAVHRSAMLANRHPKLQAAVVSVARDVKFIRQQIEANVWCIDPMERSYFELRNIHLEISS